MAVNKSIYHYENKHNKAFSDKPIKVIERVGKYIYFETEFGICKKNASKFGLSSYNIDSAINKTDYLIKVLIKNYGNHYDYSLVEWKNSKEKIILNCKIHGLLSINTNSAMNADGGCKECFKDRVSIALSSNIEKFIEKSNKIHNFKYNYSKTIYDKSFKSLKIICPIHGEFEQNANSHLQGHGCKKCSNKFLEKINSKNPPGWNINSWINSANNTKNFDSYKLYIIKCWNENEEFYKIGRTYRKTNDRFRTGMPYKYEIIKEIIGEAIEIYELEKKLKQMNKENKYFPKTKFSGRYECFTKIHF